MKRLMIGVRAGNDSPVWIRLPLEAVPSINVDKAVHSILVELSNKLPQLLKLLCKEW